MRDQRVEKAPALLEHLVTQARGFKDAEPSASGGPALREETGIGKTVNGFRKHSDVGDVAKAIVVQWKKLVPDGKEQDQKPKIEHDKKERVENKTARHSTEDKVLKSINSSKSAESGVNKNKPLSKEKSEKSISNKEHSGKLKNHSNTADHKLNSSDSPEKVEKHSSLNSAGEKKKTPQNCKLKHTDKSHNIMVKISNQSSERTIFSDEDFETPTMSFESYLNYDQSSSKRKKRSHSSTEPPKKIQVCKQYCNLELSKTETLPTATNNTEHFVKPKDAAPCVSEGKTGSLEDLLNVPLPKFLPEHTMFSSPPHFTEFKEDQAHEVTEPEAESSVFTGRRLNSKMLVYSGSKLIYLPKMLTLYEQCLRVLQNNVDAIQEVGGVPFDILEPVLQRCTPEQLSRIEECNPAFIEDSDHLWKKHCERDFKNQRLLEYESWREMYMRLFSEREEKLKMITQNISYAHSGKPKGRQVKLAYIHGAAKPPRNIRRKQEINGTAGPIEQLHPLDKLKLKSETRDKCATINNPNVSNPSTTTSINHSGGQNQDQRRAIKRIAPMMAKSMRAFRNRVGPR
ncbi:elongin-A-like [Bombina bombina]|uniref:elongin-A-like n=1 Tax=Bombina bombina TaxID=8345 RepID=UPI00235B1B9E|nr:elongin-A-like [Bombina bombina]